MIFNNSDSNPKLEILRVEKKIEATDFQKRLHELIGSIKKHAK